jgi:phage N-6-adenine-methyltransferase
LLEKLTEEFRAAVSEPDCEKTKTMPRVKCKFCREWFEAERRSARFCCPAHRVAAHWKKTNGKTNAKYVSASGGDCDWMSPRHVIEAVRKVLGGRIDLDPASSEPAQKRIRARTFYTAKDGGLTKAWRGRTFVNPPYSRGHIERFVAKLVDEVKTGNVTAAILLVNSTTSARWYHKALDASSAICLPRGNLEFEKPNGDKGKNPVSSSLFYFGNDVAAFRKVFGRLGTVLER